MLKKSSGQRKGVPKGIQRNRVGGKKAHFEQEGENIRSGDRKFLGIRASKYSALGRKCFKLMVTACEKFHLVGFTRTEDGEFVPLNRKAQVWHYTTLICLTTMLIQKTWFTIEDLTTNELRVETFFGLGLFAIYMLSFMIGAGVVMRPQETMDMLNSWSYVSPCLEDVDPNFEFDPLNNISTCLKVVSVYLVAQAILLACTSVGLIWNNLPQNLVPMLDRFGVLPTTMLPRFAWQILFAPLEFLSFLLPACMIAFSASALFMGNGALDIYLEKLREFKVDSLETRGRMERMYVRLELFNKIFQVWGRFFFPGILVASSFGVTFLLFIFIRYTTLPLLMWLYLGYAGFSIAFVLFWQFYDLILVTRASEDVLGDLWRHDVRYFRRMKRQMRLDVMKRARAMKPVIFSLGNSEFSVGVAIATWDEIINQIFFLLSL